MNRSFYLLSALLVGFFIIGFSAVETAAQDSVSVTFRYYATESAVRAYVPGEFNGWGPNNSGQIAVDAPSRMNWDSTGGFWYKSVKLQIGGGSATIDGNNGYEYKFHEHYNSSGSEWQWFVDPINPLSVTDGSGNTNSVIPVQHPMVFQLQPANDRVLQEDDPSIWAAVAAKASDSIDVAASEIYLNGQLLSSMEGHYRADRQLLHVDSLSAIGGELINGSNTLKVKAVTKAGNTRSDSTVFDFIGSPDVPEESRPPGLKDGITYSKDGTSVTLSLFAPHKQFVYVIGDFNNWQVSSDYLMKRDSVNADSVYYWIKIDNLSPGNEYAFQYLVDGNLRVTDPYTHKILDPNHDQHISETTYPDLKPYPRDKTEEITGVLQPGKSTYNWQATDYQRPNKEDLVIYEMLVRDFVQKHDYQTLVDTLDYLDRLGVNAIELMPVMEFEGNISWGYNPSFHLAADKYYGPARDLKRFIDECHKRGIAVILDMVLNHAYGQSPLVRLWNQGDYGNPTSENPYLNTEAKHDFNVGYDFNHESAATQYFVDRVNRYWLNKFRFDGFRFDLSKGFTQKNTKGDVGAWGEYDASRVRLLKRMADKIWQVDSTAYVILEHFAENREEKELADYGMMVWEKQTDPYNEATMGYHDNNKSNFSNVYFKNQGWSHPRLVGYMESHDEQRLMFKNLAYGNSSGSYNIQELNTALNRQKMAGAFFLTIPGPKMIWQFGELGYEVDIDQNGRTGPKPIRWNYRSDVNRYRLYKTWKALIRLRNSHNAFTSPNSNVSLSVGGTNKRIAFDHNEFQAVVMGNFGVANRSVQPMFHRPGTWFDYFSGDTLDIQTLDTTMTYQPGEFHVYTTSRFDPPGDKILTDLKESEEPEQPTSFELHQNYPNPFNPSTTIRYEVARPANVQLTVYDILGREVERLVNNERKTAGVYSTRFDASGLSSGIYIIHFKAGTYSELQKMTLVK